MNVVRGNGTSASGFHIMRAPLDLGGPLFLQRLRRHSLTIETCLEFGGNERSVVRRKHEQFVDDLARSCVHCPILRHGDPLSPVRVVTSRSR